MAQAPIPFDRFYRWVCHWVRVTRTFTFGLLLCVFFGRAAEPRLIAGPSVHLLVLKAWSVAAVWCLVAMILEPWGRLEWESESGFHWPRGRKNWMQIVLFACIFLSVDEKTQIWAAPAVCFSAFGLVWLQSTPARRRWPIAPVGWLWGGIYPLTVAWPNLQRFDLALLIGGIGMALQGIVEILRSLRPPADGSHQRKTRGPG
jgi:hypothetical protein